MIEGIRSIKRSLLTSVNKSRKTYYFWGFSLVNHLDRKLVNNSRRTLYLCIFTSEGINAFRFISQQRQEDFISLWLFTSACLSDNQSTTAGRHFIFGNSLWSTTLTGNQSTTAGELYIFVYSPQMQSQPFS